MAAKKLSTRKAAATKRTKRIEPEPPAPQPSPTALPTRGPAGPPLATGLNIRRVLRKTERPVAAGQPFNMAPPPTSAPPPPPSGRHPYPALLVGAAVLVLCAAGIVTNFAVPWIAPTEGDDDALDRSEIQKGSEDSDYRARLVLWPLLVFIFGIVVGAALIALEFAPVPAAVARAIFAAAFGVLAFLGFVLTLTGTRWLGGYFLDLTLAEEPPYHLHAAPYINLGVGLVMLGLGAWYAVHAIRDILAHPVSPRMPSQAFQSAAWTVVICAGGLLVLPFLPYVHVKLGGSGDVLQIQSVDGFSGEEYLSGLGKAADQFSSFDNFPGVSTRLDKDAFDWAEHGFDVTYAMLWVCLYASLVALVAAIADRAGRPHIAWSALGQTYSLVALALLVGIPFMIVMYVNIPATDFSMRSTLTEADASLEFDTSLSFNFLPPILYAGLAWFAVQHTVHVAIPTWRTVVAQRSPPTQNPPAWPKP